MTFERGHLGLIPFAATGTGPPLVVLAGLTLRQGVASDATVRGALAPVRHLARTRRLVVLNRWSPLPTDLDMGTLAAEHARALAALDDGPVDVLGQSTGGSIALQLAAEHPGTVRRLAVLSAAHRLGERAGHLQGTAARELAQGRTRDALGLVAETLAPRLLRAPARLLGGLAGRALLRDPQDVADLTATLRAEDAFDLTTCRGTVTAPTVVIGGTRDRLYGSGMFRETSALIAGSRLVLVPRGHLMTASHPRVRASLAGFFA